MLYGDSMKQMEEFNFALNQSQQRRSELSESYKENVDIAIRSLLRSKPTKDQVLLIGTGRCNDVSLPIFLESCSRVIATDVDRQSLEECVKRKQVQMEVVEYTGFGQAQFFEQFPQRMWNATSKHDIEQFVAETMEQVESYQFLADYHGTNDIVFVSPIYTQLVYQQVLHELAGLRRDGYSEDLADYMTQRMLDHMPGIIERFNSNLIRLLKPDGTLFVLSDVFELEHGSDFYRKIALAIKQKDVMDEIYENYRNEFGLGLGDYGLYDLNERMIRSKNRWLLWQFDEQKSYAVHLNIFHQSTNEGGTL